MPDPTAQQQDYVTAVHLAAIGESGFALAGAGAIRAHGLTDRPTQDIDLFGGPTVTADDFSVVLQRGEDALRAAHYTVTRVREFPLFTRMRVTSPDGAMLDVDFAINWRADPPVQMSVGPVLSERDAVAGKLSAVYSRGEVRDFLDLDAIRTSGRYTDPELIALGHEHDDGFDAAMFAQQLSRVIHIYPSEAAEYGITEQALDNMKRRIMNWAILLRDSS